MKLILQVVGIVVLLFGLLFVCQGLGLVRWPAESFMIDNTRWVYYGAAIAIFGLFIVFYARR
jgi:multisubunit Na+/H+ antiporter MnhG subunit